MLSDLELERYARHIVLKEIGGPGQAQLKASHVAIVGVGGLGAPVALYLAAAGIGRLTLIDDDKVSLSNLQRQVIYQTAEVGEPKVACAARHLRALNDEITVIPLADRLDRTNATALLGGANVICDGSDGFATRHAVNEAAVRLKVPIVSGALGSFSAQLAVFAGFERETPCYQCFVPAGAIAVQRSCADEGIIGALAGVVGALQAL
ncbi:MAG: HesA/MoeB/ThiF family protein, partial [Pseudomonadota bacterium]